MSCVNCYMVTIIKISFINKHIVLKDNKNNISGERCYRRAVQKQSTSSKNLKGYVTCFLVYIKYTLSFEMNQQTDTLHWSLTPYIGLQNGVIKYRWLRNGNLFNASKSQDSYVYPNGTLRLAYRVADGQFRCVANGSRFDAEESLIDTGAIVSRAVQVHQVGKHNVFITFIFRDKPDFNRDWSKHSTKEEAYRVDVRVERPLKAMCVRWCIPVIVSESIFKHRIHLSVFNRMPATNETTAVVGGSAVIVCPFVSVPSAHVSWWFANNTQVTFGSGEPHHFNDGGNRRVTKVLSSKEHYYLTRISHINLAPLFLHRFILLQNGSLLILHARLSDGQRFRCLARNQHSTNKPERNYTTLLQVLPSDQEGDGPMPPSRLLPPFQDNLITLKEGQSVELVCAGRTLSDVTWSASSHLNSGQAAHPVEPLTVTAVNVLRLQNLTLAHTARYKCSTADDFQVSFGFLWAIIGISYRI